MIRITQYYKDINYSLIKQNNFNQNHVFVEVDSKIYL